MSICFIITLTGSALCSGVVYAQQAEEFLSALSSVTKDTTDIAALLTASDRRNLDNPNLSDDGIEIDFVLEYSPLGRRYLTVYIIDDEAFLPLFDLFNLLKINISYTSSQRIANGFYIDEDKEYFIDFLTQTIQVGGRTGSFSDDDIRVGNNGFYLKPHLFADMFDLHFEVEPSRLRLVLETEVILPLQTMQQRDQARSQIQGMSSGREFYQLEFPRNRKLFGSGFLDYQLSGSAFESLRNNTQQFSAAYGFELLGGDMSGRLNMNRTSTGQLQTSTDLSTWRFVISDNSYMTTVRAGNVSTQGLSGGRVRGVTFTNEPLYTPAIFDVYPIFGTTEPQTQVELLLNNRLVDFTIVDESGEYELFVPIRYGNTTLEVVEYLPDGRILRELKDLRIPGSFLTSGEVRYSGTVGLAENRNNGLDTNDLKRDDLAGSLAVSAGITRRLTATQTFYFRENEFDPWPELSSSLAARVGTGYLVNITAAPGSRYDLQLSTLSVSNFNFSGSYTYFKSGNTQNGAVRQQANGGLSLPLRIIPNRPLQLSFSGTYRDLRTGGNQFSYRASTGFSLSALRFRVTYRDQLSPQSLFSATEGARATYTVSTNTGNLPFISRLTGRVSLTANLDHDVENRQFTNFSMRAYKSFSSRTSFNASFDRDLISGISSFQAGLQIRFNKARTTTNTRISENSHSIVQTLSGSVGYDDNFNRFVLSERNMVGSSAVSVVQFMDTNANESYDSEDEILAFDGIGFVTGGQKQLGSDGVLRIWQLPAYRQVNMTIDNIRNPNPTSVTHLDQFSIFTDPNRFKLIEIPYDYSGVAIGGIYRVNRGEKTGLGGANFIIRAKDGSFETEQRTFSDGGFYVMDIPPGDYILELSPLLVSFMDVGDQVTQTEFTITPRDGGDFVDGIDIVLQGEPLLVPIEPEPQSESIVEDLFVYQVQLGSFKNPKLAENLVIHLNRGQENLFNIYYSDFTQQFSVRTDTLHQKEVAMYIRDRSSELLNNPDAYSLPDPFIVYLYRGHFDTGEQSYQNYYALQAGVFNVRSNADELASRISGQSVRFPSESRYRVFKDIFKNYDSAEDRRQELIQGAIGGHRDYFITRIVEQSSSLPKPVLYRIQYATFSVKQRAKELAKRVDAVVVKMGEDHYRVLSAEEKEFPQFYGELPEYQSVMQINDIRIVQSDIRPMRDLHRIIYNLTARDSKNADQAFRYLCRIVSLTACGEFVQGNRNEDYLSISPNTVNSEFILEIDRKRKELEEFFIIDRYMEQIPVVEVLKQMMK